MDKNLVNLLMYPVSHKLRCFKHPKWCRFLMLQTDASKAGLREREQAALWRKRRDAREPLYQAACWWKLPMLGSRESNKDGQIFDHIWRCCFYFFSKLCIFRILSKNGIPDFSPKPCCSPHRLPPSGTLASTATWLHQSYEFLQNETSFRSDGNHWNHMKSSFMNATKPPSATMIIMIIVGTP